MNGIDTSHHNGSIDWHKVAANTNYKVDFCIMKATEGTGYIDPMVKTNALATAVVGIPTGYYHFADLNGGDVVADATAQANHFLSTLKSQPLPDASLPYILDIEKNAGGLSKDQVLLWINTFFGVWTSAGATNFWIYSYASFLNENLPADHGLGNIPLWIAAYVNASEPTLPIGWNDYIAWQFRQDGSVDGITGNVDSNIFKGTLNPA